MTEDAYVSLHNLSVSTSLRGKRLDILHDISINIREGEFVAIVGESGSGKSTLLHILGGLMPPTTGEVIVGDKAISNLSAKTLAEYRLHNIGFIFQSFYLQPYLSLADNIAIPGLLAGRKKIDVYNDVKSLAVYLGLTDRLDHLPKQMSGGEIQRGAIARSLINSPKLLLADEPTGNLDTKNSQIVAKILQDICTSRGSTVVVATHSTSLASIAQRQLQLCNGGILS